MSIDKEKIRNYIYSENTQLYIFGRWGRSNWLCEQGNLYLKYKREDSTKNKKIFRQDSLSKKNIKYK